MLIAFHKPYGVLAQFTPEAESKHGTLAAFGFPSGVYPIGRLDADSEGLLLLSDESALNARLLQPEQAHRRRYWAQVEGSPDASRLRKLEQGITIQGRHTLPCRAWRPDPVPTPLPRDPPIRYRKNVADCWLALDLTEGRNRQVRRMTAAIGHPTLRLIRVRIGGYDLGDLPPGEWRVLNEEARSRVLQKS